MKNMKWPWVEKAYLILLMVIGLTLVPFAFQTVRIWGISKETYGDKEGIEELATSLEKQVAILDQSLSKKMPRGNYLIINSSANEFTLKNGMEVLRKDQCSTGSYIKLKGENNQQWMFKTPQGEYKILAKTVAPVWKKPDWAFVEAGLSIPSANHPSRFEYGVLGDYSLSIGNGYLIHGTLYQRFLGLPVTHGCVRLNDENLEIVYKSLPVGAKVYIF